MAHPALIGIVFLLATLAGRMHGQEDRLETFALNQGLLGGLTWGTSAREVGRIMGPPDGVLSCDAVTGVAFYGQQRTLIFHRRKLIGAYFGYCLEWDVIPVSISQQQGPYYKVLPRAPVTEGLSLGMPYAAIRACLGTRIPERPQARLELVTNSILLELTFRNVPQEPATTDPNPWSLWSVFVRHRSESQETPSAIDRARLIGIIGKSAP